METEQNKQNSSEFLERSKLIELQRKADLEKHKLKMKELVYMRESDVKRHEQEMERQRIKSAEIRKTQQRKEAINEYYK